MDQESEGKDKSSPDKQEPSPQVSRHVTMHGAASVTTGVLVLLGYLELEEFTGQWCGGRAKV